MVDGSKHQIEALRDWMLASISTAKFSLQSRLVRCTFAGLNCGASVSRSSELVPS